MPECAWILWQGQMPLDLLCPTCAARTGIVQVSNFAHQHQRVDVARH